MSVLSKEQAAQISRNARNPSLRFWKGVIPSWLTDTFQVTWKAAWLKISKVSPITLSRKSIAQANNLAQYGGKLKRSAAAHSRALSAAWGTNQLQPPPHSAQQKQHNLLSGMPLFHFLSLTLSSSLISRKSRGEQEELSTRLLLPRLREKRKYIRRRRVGEVRFAAGKLLLLLTYIKRGTRMCARIM